MREYFLCQKDISAPEGPSPDSRTVDAVQQLPLDLAFDSSHKESSHGEFSVQQWMTSPAGDDNHQRESWQLLFRDRVYHVKWEIEPTKAASGLSVQAVRQDSAGSVVELDNGASFHNPHTSVHAPQSVSVYNPAEDYTPPEFITLLITDLGVVTPSAVSDELIMAFDAGIRGN